VGAHLVGVFAYFPFLPSRFFSSPLFPAINHFSNWAKMPGSAVSCLKWGHWAGAEPDCNNLLDAWSGLVNHNMYVGLRNDIDIWQVFCEFQLQNFNFWMWLTMERGVGLCWCFGTANNWCRAPTPNHINWA